MKTFPTEIDAKRAIHAHRVYDSHKETEDIQDLRALQVSPRRWAVVRVDEETGDLSLVSENDLAIGLSAVAAIIEQGRAFGQPFKRVIEA